MANRYDHRLRYAIVNTGNPALFKDLNIPRSTIRDWFRKGPVQVVTSPELAMTHDELIQEIAVLKRTAAQADAKSTLLCLSLF
jgi:hypothetical protein